MRRIHIRLAMALLLTAAGCLAPTLARADFKVGLDEVDLSGAKYTHDANGTKTTVSTDMVGTQLALEWLPTDFVGFEIDYSAAPLQRNYELGSSGAISNNVTETASFTTFGANFYPFREEKRGIHPLIGVAAGTIDVSQKFEGGTLGNVSTTNSVTINQLKLGLEWVGNRAGVRLQYGIWSGSTSNTTKLTGVRQTNDYSGSAVSLGVFALF